MTEVVFETAGLAAAFAKAASIAPTTGLAFDKASGIVLEVDPENRVVVLKSTNLDVYYMEWLEPLEISGPRAVWRVPSRVFASVISTLPIGSGKRTKLYDKGDTIYLESGRTKLNRQTIYGDYPEWGAFDPDDLVEVLDFSGKYERVVWAASKSNDPPFTGIYFGNGILAATDRYKIAVVPIESPFEDSVLVQAVTLGALVKPSTPVKVGRTDTQLLLAPDAHTQVRVGLLGMDFPGITRIMRRSQPQEISAGKEELLAMLTRAKHVVGSDRELFTTMIVGREEIAFMVKSDDNGLFGDVVDVAGAALHKRVKIKFNQNNLAAALANSPHEMVNVCYDPDDMMKPIRIYSGQDEHIYEAWVAPIKNEESQT